MTRKRLPKVISRASEKPREVIVDAPAGEPRAKSLTRRRAPTSPADEQAALPRSAGLQETAPRQAAQASSAPVVESPPIEGEVLPPAPIHAEPQAVRRRRVAQKVVERYKLYAAMGGLSPLPIVNVAGVTAVNMQMVKTLSNLYEVPFERDLTRSIIAGLMGGVVPTGLGAVTASTLALAVPGVAFVGVAVSSLTAAALTGRIGSVFVERFESAAAPQAGSAA